MIRPKKKTGAKRKPAAPNAKNAIMVSRYSDAVIIEVDGLGNMNNSVMFSEFMNAMLEKGYRKFIINLANCTGMDSTFMGSLLGVSLRLQELGNGWITVVNPGDSNLRLLAMLGVTQFVRVQEKPIKMENIEKETLPNQEVGHLERLKLIQKAHENLVQIDERNQQKFGAFLDMLTKEIQKES